MRVAIAVSVSGDIIVAGTTQSRDFPTPGGAKPHKQAPAPTRLSSRASPRPASSPGPPASAAATTTTPTPSRPTFRATSGSTGSTSSSDFPVPGGFQTSLDGDQDAFIVKISSLGAITWGTFLGGSDETYAYSIAPAGRPAFWVVGETYSADFPVTR